MRWSQRKLAWQKHVPALQIEGGLPNLTLDEGKIEQVLNNLISNAVKFSQPGAAVEVRACAQDDGVIVSVQDYGPGIPEAERAKLFQPYGRTSVRSTTSGRSKGLGLAISRKIVEGHGGHIRVKSQLGAGSIIRASIRIAAANEYGRPNSDQRYWRAMFNFRMHDCNVVRFIQRRAAAPDGVDVGPDRARPAHPLEFLVLKARSSFG